MTRIRFTFDPDQERKAEKILSQCGSFVSEKAPEAAFALHVGSNHLELRSLKQNFDPLIVNFLSGRSYHRYRYGGGRGQLIAKACGIKSKTSLNILDATGGLAGDAFVLATLGADVRVLERHPVIAALVKDGLDRAKSAEEFQALKIDLINQDAIRYMQTTRNPRPDIVYVDPMYPHRKKKSLVKKEMRIIRDIVGNDEDSDLLLHAALKFAKKKVVVKRPSYADYLNGAEPQLQYQGKNSRYDVYLVKYEN